MKHCSFAGQALLLLYYRINNKRKIIQSDMEIKYILLK